MPYFVYKIYPNRTLDFIESHESYRDAKKKTYDLRDTLEEEDNFTYRLVHASHEREAVRLLTAKREARPLGEE